MEIPVAGVVAAMKGKEILAKQGIRAVVGKKSGENGCYYYLKIADKQFYKVENLLKNTDIFG